MQILQNGAVIEPTNYVISNPLEPPRMNDATLREPHPVHGMKHARFQLVNYYL